MPPKSTEDSSVNSFWLPSEILPIKSFLPQSADEMLVQAETTKSLQISLTYMLDYFH